MYEDIIEDEMNELKEMIRNNKINKNVSNNFVRDYDWEDEFSHNQIGEMQKEFMVQAQEYLKEICKGKYGMYCDWCVHICTIEFLKDRNIIRYILC